MSNIINKINFLLNESDHRHIIDNIVWMRQRKKELDLKKKRKKKEKEKQINIKINGSDPELDKPDFIKNQKIVGRMYGHTAADKSDNKFGNYKEFEGKVTDIYYSLETKLWIVVLNNDFHFIWDPKDELLVTFNKKSKIKIDPKTFGYNGH